MLRSCRLVRYCSVVAWGYLLGKNKHEGHPGHFSFSYRHKAVAANMHFGAGAGRHTIQQRGRSFKADAWNHLALSYDGKTMCFYINGQLQGSADPGVARPLGHGTLSLGRRGDGGGPILPALFDQVRIWDRALTANEIKAHSSQPETLATQQGLRYAENFDRYSPEAVVAPQWNDVTMRIRLKTEADCWEASQLVQGTWPLWEERPCTCTAMSLSSP